MFIFWTKGQNYFAGQIKEKECSKFLQPQVWQKKPEIFAGLNSRLCLAWTVLTGRLIVGKYNVDWPIGKATVYEEFAWFAYDENTSISLIPEGWEAGLWRMRKLIKTKDRKYQTNANTCA